MPDPIVDVSEAHLVVREEIVSDEPRLSLLFYASGVVRFRHTCDRGARGVIICAPLLTRLNQPGGHQIESAEPGHVTVSPSILCDDCGTHGFVRDGKWVAA